MTLLSPSETSIRQAADILLGGGLLAIPTETVYGLAASAFNATACARIFEAKQRPAFDPLIVHIARDEQLDAVAESAPEQARALMGAFWPGPLTLVLAKRKSIPDLVTSGLPTVAIRMPDNAVARAIIERSGPLAAPSANLFGRVSPTTAQHVAEQLGDRIDAIMDDGPCRVGVESTIIGWRSGKPALLRAGGLPVEDAERVIGPIARLVRSPGKESPKEFDPAAHPDSPGQLSRHYAPLIRTVLREPSQRDEPIDASLMPAAWVGIGRPAHPEQFEEVESLSPSGDIREAAARLFAALHRLETHPGIKTIVAERAPEAGLGLAINDRLARASASK